jgi:NAD(P)-dependent dehydrogenase (short-subunit alcohol dehydrogenase family)
VSSREETPLLIGKVALVTGAGRGLGRDVAAALARCGADLVLAGRTIADLKSAAAAIERGYGRRALVVETDVSQPADVERLHRQACAAIGPTSVIVNAAGVFGPVAPLVDNAPSEFIRTIMVNTVGPFLTAHAFVPDMVKCGWGRIVNISSAGALLPPVAHNSAYSTAKAGLNRLTRQLAVELEGTGVTANVIHPGSLKTEMWADIRRQTARLPDGGGALGEWGALVERTGGDSPAQAVALVLRLIAASNEVNGGFHWSEGSHQVPVPSW